MSFDALIDGYQRFRAGAYLMQKRRWDALAKGQSPAVMLISCCDSRVDPSTIFDTVPGQLFVLRNVANLVPPYASARGPLGTSSAIEYAVTELEVRHLVVMGHGMCGGIAASLANRDLGAPGRSFIDEWISLLDGARAKVQEQAAKEPGLNLQHALELEGIRTSLANLRTFPFVREAEEAGRVKLHGAFFAIADGELHVMDPDSGQFAPAN